MRWLILALAIFAVGLVAAQSQNNKIKEGAKHGSNHRAGTDQSPLVVKLLPSPEAQEEAANQKREREEKAELDRKLVQLTNDLARYTGDLAFFTEVIAGLAFLQLFVFGYQSWQLKRTVDTAVIESQPVLSPAVINMDSLHQIVPNGTAIVFNGTETFKSAILFIFENFGKTPGIIRRVRADLFLTENDRIPAVNWNALPIHHHQETVRGESRREEWKGPAVDLKTNFTVNSAEFNELLAESNPDNTFRRFFLVGFVVYDDFYGVRHTRRFCLKMRLTESIRFQAQHGGAAYNSIKREKIPKNDPLEEAEPAA